MKKKFPKAVLSVAPLCLTDFCLCWLFNRGSGKGSRAEGRGLRGIAAQPMSPPLQGTQSNHTNTHACPHIHTYTRIKNNNSRRCQIIHRGETPTCSPCGRCRGVPVPWVARGGGGRS